ncbi:uncharacterized protein BO97DRAFT_479415 [Aspergillus homomorphus CBS 101889]|uniref:Uncharacterized protein n=1 Tax=Aspergillus homomorphus (strain CBS 101889) TaxID=1450537 RepID=A0A395HTI9_ASPHC|nr:hypothetical protein BO97DRAFT_479415 [Aspergillus homomorphus CBS 101889]RAL10138.1 hypothetical protein BO97DRAFT_479415 [Aspergillus homomorphus CBS 101889]
MGSLQKHYPQRVMTSQKWDRPPLGSRMIKHSTVYEEHYKSRLGSVRRDEGLTHHVVSAGWLHVTS